MNTLSRCRAILLVSILGFGAWVMTAPAQPVSRNESPPVFSHSTAITNTYLPLARLHRDVLEGNEGKTTVRIERTMKTGTRRFTRDGHPVVARIMEDREFTGGKLCGGVCEEPAGGDVTLRSHH